MKIAGKRSTDVVATRFARGIAAAIALVLAAGFTTPARAEIQWLDRIAAIVDDDVIMESDISQRMTDVQGQLAERHAAVPPDDVLRKQVLERLIMESIQMQLGTRMGVRIDDDAINNAIGGIARQNGMTLREFVDRLGSEGVDYATFREQMRRDMVMNRVRQRRVGDRVHVTDSDVADFLKSADARDMFSGSFRIAHILVAVPQSAGVDQVKAASDKADKLVADARAGADFSDLAVRNSDAGDALEGGDLGWRNGAQLPSLFASVVTGMKPGDIIGPLRSASGFHIVKLVERKGDAERVVQQAKVRHILVKPSAIRTSGEAKEFALQLHDRIARGEDFAEVAKKNSEDYGSALSGGDLGWVSPGQMVDEFETVVNATQPGQLSDVFETQFGWHFLQVLERRDQDTSDDFRKLQARNAVWKRKFDTETENWMRELRNEAWVDIKTADGKAPDNATPATPAAKAPE